MSVRVQRWAERRPLTFGLAALVFAIGGFLGGIAWMNQAEGAVAPDTHALGICQHKTQVEVEDLNGSTVELVNRITAYWRTSGASPTSACAGSTVTLTSASYWCSWGGGWTASCSGWSSTAGHAEVDAHDCNNWKPTCWTEHVTLDVDRNGNVSYHCLVTAGYPDSINYTGTWLRCSVTRIY